MKRIETMTNDEVLAMLNNKECTGCKAFNFCVNDVTVGCRNTLGQYLAQEIEIKPRWATIQSNEHLDALFEEWLEDDNTKANFQDWLKEEVEV